MFEEIFPLKLYLHIFQLEGYKWTRLVRWVISNPFKRSVEGKKPLGWSGKAKALYFISYLWIGVLAFLWWPAAVAGILQPWILLVLAIATIKPYEAVRIRYTIWSTREKIRGLKKRGLRVVGIGGSYGKTSTKEFLYQILKSKYQVLRTPESYNTVFGIAKVVEWELDDTYDFFICEMGAYKRGEVAQLCLMVEPDFGMLTGINEQHLERFGSIENTIRAKFELVEFVKTPGRLVLNFGNDSVRQHAPSGVGAYGQNKYKHPQEQNIEGAAKMARILGMKDEDIKRATAKIKQPAHRLTVIKRGEMTIIDDAYSSNVDGFKAAIKYLDSFGGWKVMITPGIAELGKSTFGIHKELGELLKRVDQVICVGISERTRGLEAGLGRQVQYVEKVGQALGKVAEPKAVVLFENDLPDNY